MLDLKQLSGPIPPRNGENRTTAQAEHTTLRERLYLGKVMLHVDPRNRRLDALDDLGFPVALPAPGCAIKRGEVCMLSISRGAYLLITPPNGQYHVITRFRAALSGSAAAVADVSSGYATLYLAGPAATELLYRGCSAPLDPPDFPVGRCITTKIGSITAIVHRIDDAPGLDLHVPRSLALSFWNWLVDAGRDCALMI